MPYWLCDARRDQQVRHIQRFDPRFWTVNFPRPMMASVVTTAPDALRVDAVFYHRDALAGLIWDSEDRLDHPLLGYATLRDYDRTSLSFHWRSQGVKPLDAVNGPTLTIEGRDGAGAARSWYVRLWNYATGTPDDAAIRLDFTALDGGFLLPGEADPVHPGDIDRMFISLVPPDYDGSTAPLAAPAEAWVELSAIRCEGHRAMLPIGDVLVPPHGLSMASAYDDSLNQTPERLLRAIEALGYRGAINHYVGMSHYFRLADQGGALFVDVAAPALNVACAAWHRDFAARAAAMGFAPIVSLSYELFDAHCPEDWKQRAENGDPALTGWVPPSTLLSPARAEAMAYLRTVAGAFAAIWRDAGLAVRFQVGEPWWWIMPDGRICLYDEAARAAFGGTPVSIASIRGTIDAAQRALLDQAGALLAASTAALAEHVRSVAGTAPVETLLLVYLPTILDAAAPEARRANLPAAWAAPAFDVLQLEDYDWTAAGNAAAQARALVEIEAQLGYPDTAQHYLAGFVLRPDQAASWRPIAAAAERALARGVAATFVWALPQVARDGFTFFRIGTEEDAMQAFDDVRFPLPLSRETSVESRFSTQIATSIGGHERRNSQWADARLSYDVGPGLRSDADLATLSAFFRARRGAARGFRLRDPFDASSAAGNGTPGPFDQRLGTGDGAAADFALVKHYGDAGDPQQRRITRPLTESVRVSVDGIESGGWTLQPLGIIRFDVAPAAGTDIRAGFLFDVPVRFAEDMLTLNAATFAAGEAPSVPLVELREAV